MAGGALGPLQRHLEGKKRRRRGKYVPPPRAWLSNSEIRRRKEVFRNAKTLKQYRKLARHLHQQQQQQPQEDEGEGEEEKEQGEQSAEEKETEGATAEAEGARTAAGELAGTARRKNRSPGFGGRALDQLSGETMRKRNRTHLGEDTGEARAGRHVEVGPELAEDSGYQEEALLLGEGKRGRRGSSGGGQGRNSRTKEQVPVLAGHGMGEGRQESAFEGDRSMGLPLGAGKEGSAGEGRRAKGTRDKGQGRKTVGYGEWLKREAAKKREEKEEEQRQRQEAAERQRAEREQKQKHRKEERSHMWKKTRRGQPVMKFRVEKVLELLQAK